MITISAIIIAKNNEDMLPGCLDSLSFCDEIIVVDGGSSDRTVSIAQKRGTSLVISKTDNFAEQRNIGLQKAQGMWVLYVDTDERVSEKLRTEIEKIMKQTTGPSAYLITRKNYYFGNNPWPKTEQLERLFRKGSLEKWVGELHESPIIHGKTGKIEGFLIHYSHRDLTSMVTKTNQWSTIEAKLRYENNHPRMVWWRFLRVMVTSFSNSYFSQDGWKAGTVGILESTYQAFSIFITYAKLWELQHRKK